MMETKDVYLHQFKREIITIEVVLTAPATSVQISGNHNLGRKTVGYSLAGSTVAGVTIGATDDERELWTDNTWVGHAIGHAAGTATLKVEVW